MLHVVHHLDDALKQAHRLPVGLVANAWTTWAKSHHVQVPRELFEQALSWCRPPPVCAP